LWNILMLSSFAFLVVLVFLSGLLPVLTQATVKSIGLQVDFVLTPQILIAYFSLSVLTGLLTSWPLIRGTRHMQARSLLSGDTRRVSGTVHKLGYLPLVTLLILASFYVSNSVLVTSLFWCALLTLAFLFYVATQTILLVMRRLRRRPVSVVRWVTRRFEFDPLAFRTLFISLCFGVLLTQLLPQVEA